MRILPTNKSASLANMPDEIYDEALLYPVSEDVPCPWDAEIRIVDDMVVVIGLLGPGGPGSGNSSCVCQVPVDKFPNYYYIEIDDSVVTDQMIDAIDHYGWKIVGVEVD